MNKDNLMVFSIKEELDSIQFVEVVKIVGRDCIGDVVSVAQVRCCFLDSSTFGYRCSEP